MCGWHPLWQIQFCRQPFTSFLGTFSLFLCKSLVKFLDWLAGSDLNTYSQNFDYSYGSQDFQVAYCRVWMTWTCFQHVNFQTSNATFVRMQSNRHWFFFLTILWANVCYKLPSRKSLLTLDSVSTVAQYSTELCVSLVWCSTVKLLAVPHLTLSNGVSDQVCYRTV